MENKVQTTPEELIAQMGITMQEIEALEWEAKCLRASYENKKLEEKLLAEELDYYIAHSLAIWVHKVGYSHLVNQLGEEAALCAKQSLLEQQRLVYSTAIRLMEKLEAQGLPKGKALEKALSWAKQSLRELPSLKRLERSKRKAKEVEVWGTSSSFEEVAVALLKRARKSGSLPHKGAIRPHLLSCVGEMAKALAITPSAVRGKIKEADVVSLWRKVK